MIGCNARNTVVIGAVDSDGCDQSVTGQNVYGCAVINHGDVVARNSNGVDVGNVFAVHVGLNVDAEGSLVEHSNVDTGAAVAVNIRVVAVCTVELPLNGSLTQSADKDTGEAGIFGVQVLDSECVLTVGLGGQSIEVTNVVQQSAVLIDDRVTSTCAVVSSKVATQVGGLQVGTGGIGVDVGSKDVGCVALNELTLERNTNDHRSGVTAILQRTVNIRLDTCVKVAGSPAGEALGTFYVLDLVEDVAGHVSGSGNGHGEGLAICVVLTGSSKQRSTGNSVGVVALPLPYLERPFVDVTVIVGSHGVDRDTDHKAFGDLESLTELLLGTGEGSIAVADTQGHSLFSVSGNDNDLDLLVEQNDGTVLQLHNKANCVNTGLEVSHGNGDLVTGSMLAAISGVLNRAFGLNGELTVYHRVVVNEIAVAGDGLIEAGPTAEHYGLASSACIKGNGVVGFIQLKVYLTGGSGVVVILTVDPEGVVGNADLTGSIGSNVRRILSEIVCSGILSGIEECDILNIDVAVLGESISCPGLGSFNIVLLAVLVQLVAGLESIETEVGNGRTVVKTLIDDLLGIKDSQMPLAVGNNGLTQHRVIVGGTCAGGADIHLDISAGGIGAVTDGNKASALYVGKGIPVGISTDRDNVQIAILERNAVLSDVAGIAADNGRDLVSLVHANGIRGVSSRDFLGSHFLGRLFGSCGGLGRGSRSGLGSRSHGSFGSGLCGGVCIGLCGGLAGSGSSGGLAAGGISGLVVRTSNGSHNQCEHEKCDEKQFLHGGASFLIFLR